jgi:hypothetical protein
MSIMFHAGRGPDGRAAGKPWGGRMTSRNPVLAARAAKRIIQDGKWRTLPGHDDRTRILLALKEQIRWAIPMLPVDGLAALAKAPPPGGCHWCALVTVLDPDRPELERSEVNLALLGQPCRNCTDPWEQDALVAAMVDETRERERLTDELCKGRPWLAAALAASAHGPDSLHAQMDRDVWRMGAHRAGQKWGINPGILTGDRAAIREVAKHPVWSWALTRGYDDAD